MVRVVWAALVTSTVLSAQYMVDERRIGRWLPLFEDGASSQSLHCSISAIPPQLNYSFRFQAGYVVAIPMSQFQGAGHRWRLLTRITPEVEGAKSTYLMSGYALPAVPPTKIELQVGGGYLLGEGGYRVRHVLVDEAGRTCRKDWHVEAHLRRGEGKVHVALPPGTVLDVSLRGSRRAPPVEVDDARPLRLTILLHAAPLMPRRTRLRPNDMLTLLSSVTSVLEHVPATSVRLVAFNLDQQREMYRKDGFGLRDLPAVAEAMTKVELGLVNVKVLQNKVGHVETVTSLVNQELTAGTPADAVVFLGPQSRFGEKPAADALKRGSSINPQFLFFELSQGLRGGPGAMGGRGGRGPMGSPMDGLPMLEPTLPDTIRHTVSRLGGKTFLIHAPGDLAKAIARLEQAAPAATAAESHTGFGNR